MSGAIVDGRESEQAVLAGLQLARHIGLLDNMTATYIVNTSDVIDSFHNIRIGKEAYWLSFFRMYSETWELGTPKGLWKNVLNSEVVLFASSISMY